MPVALPHPDRPALPRASVSPPAIPYFGLRAVLIALVLTPLCAYWAAEQIVDVIVSLMVPPVSCLLLLIVGNVVVRWVAPRAALTPTELVIIYGMLQVATAIAAEWMWVINPLIASFSVFKER